MGVNKKAKMTPIGFFISFLIIVVIGIVVINYTADIAEDIDTVVTTNSSNETILIESSTTLAPIGTTTTSSEVKANNQTYADFDGDGDYINFTSNNLDLFNKNEFTHIIFAKINNVNQDTQMILGTNSHLNYLNDAQGIIRLQNTGKLNILLNTTDDSSVQSSSGVLRNNTWEFIGGSYDNESYDLYLNSTRDVSLSVFGGNITGFYSSNYLSRANSGRYLNGSINSFKFYNRSLNSEMMAYSYNKEILGGNKGVGILEILYHKVGEGISTSTNIDIINFTNQMNLLYSLGFETITFENYYQWTQDNFTMPEKPLIIRFDDGWKSVYTNATPIMDNIGYIGNIALIVETVYVGDNMNFSDISNLNSKGWNILSHSVTHTSFLTLSEDDRINELNNSKNNLTALGYNIRTFIYPGHQRNDTTDLECLEYYDICHGGRSVIDGYRFYKSSNLTGNNELKSTDMHENITLDSLRYFDLDYGLLVNYNLNENTGTTAHDTSGNSNDGTIIGATWVTDGILVTLTAITDYTINPTTGLFTLANNDYSWSELFVSWDYKTVTDRNLPANTILHLIEIFIGILFIAVAWLYIKGELF